MSQSLRSHPALPWVAALAVMLMWASSFVVIRAGGAHLSPGAMSLLRIGSATAALIPLVVLGKVRVLHTGRMWMAVVMWGVAWFAAYTIVLNASEALIDAATAAMVVYMGVFPTAVAFLLWGYALTRTPAGVLTSSSLLVPAFTVALSWLFFGEMPPLLAALRSQRDDHTPSVTRRANPGSERTRA